MLEISLTEQQTAQHCPIQNPREIKTIRLFSYRWINIIIFLVTICLCIQQCSHSTFYFFDPLRCLALTQFYIPYETFPRNCRSHATMCTTPLKEYHKLAQAIIERQVGGPSAQMSERTSASESLV